MALDREYKEFFLRDAQETGGSYPDQEVGFPIEYQVDIPGGGSITVKNRYLTEHYPSQDVFTKLFNSQAFQLNVEDTATEAYQGLVKRGTSAQFALGMIVDSDGYFLVYPLNIITSAISDAQLIDGISFDDETRILTFDFPTPTVDLNVDTHTTIHGGITGPSVGLATGIGKDLDYFIDNKANNSLYIRGAGDSWYDTGLDFLGTVSMTVSSGVYSLSQNINGTVIPLGTSWEAGSLYDIVRTDNTTYWTFDWMKDGSVDDTFNIDKNTKLWASVQGDLSVDLYNGISGAEGSVVATIPSPSTSSQVIYGTIDPSSVTPGTIGSDNDTYINTADGTIWLNISNIWTFQVCFSQCDTYVPSYTFRASSATQDITSLVSYTTFDISADDTLSTSDSYDPDNVWQGSTYVKAAGAGATESHKIFITGDFVITKLLQFNVSGTDPIGYKLTINAVRADDPSFTIGDSYEEFFLSDGVDCSSTTASTSPEYGTSKTVKISALLDLGILSNISEVNNVRIIGRLTSVTTGHPCTNVVALVTGPMLDTGYSATLENVLISNIIS